jgi:hypothetical protein
VAKQLADLHAKDPRHVHLIAGPREIQALSVVAGGMASDATVQYLSASKLVECLGPDAMDDRGTNGLWVKCTGMSTTGGSIVGGNVVGKLPGVGVMGANGPRAEWIESPAVLSPIAWKDELNRRWQAVAANPKALRDASPDKWQFWMTLGLLGALDDEALPARGLDTAACKSTAVFARPAAFGTIRRTLVIDKQSLLITQGDVWMDIGPTDSLYWAVQTWCSGTMRAMASHTLPMLDRTLNLSELQYDLNCTLSSLVQHSERASALTPPAHPWANFGKLRGQLGPCVCGGREGQEVLRAVHWRGPGMPDVLMLISEQYVRYALRDYFQTLVAARDMGSRAVTGFLILHGQDLISMRIPGLSEAEQMHANEAMGARLWKLSTVKQSAESGEHAMQSVASAPSAWRAAGASGLLTPGQRIESTGQFIFYTHTTSSDPLQGLMVKWAFAPGEAADAKDMPTIDLANGDFEVIV